MLKVLGTVLIFTLVNSLLIHENRYIVSNVQATFLKAYAVCKRNGWTLATERNVEDVALLNTLIRNQSAAHWLGGYLQQGGQFEDGWIWLDSGIPLEYKNWQHNEPLAEKIGVYYCLKKNSLDDCESGKWYAESCWTEHYFICQKPQIN